MRWLILLDVALFLGFLFVVAKLAIRYTPPVRQIWQRLNGRKLEERASLYCPQHGAIDPLDAVVDTIGSKRCPKCYTSHLSKGLY